MRGRETDKFEAQPPVVDYKDINEYHDRLNLCKAQYCALIHRVIHRHFSNPSPHRWTSTDAACIGLADFDEFISDGLIIILRLTKFRGLRWCQALNHEISTVMNMTCRTFVHINFMFAIPREDGFNVQRFTPGRQGAPCADVMHSALVDLLTSERSLNSTTNYTAQLLHANFCLQPNPSWFFAMPRWQWQAFMHAVVCMLHVNLQYDVSHYIMHLVWGFGSEHFHLECFLQKRYRSMSSMSAC